jgi:LemA protein
MIVGAAVAALVVLLLAVVAVGYNQLVRARVAVDNAWAQIDVQLKRRFDLIPNLVATVEGYAAHERETLEAVTQLRAEAMSAQGPAQLGEMHAVLSGALRGLFAVAERYPDLKASANFLKLQGQLSETEDRIAYARQYYNDAVFTYNRLLAIFPSNVLASLTGFQRREFFQARTAERSPVPVSFGS